MKYLVQYGIKRLGASEIDSKIQLNDYFSGSTHLKTTSFLIIFCKGRMISEKLGINLLTKFIFPRKDCIAFLLEGKVILDMSWVHLGSIVIPCFDTTHPNKRPCVTTNIVFLGFKETPYFLQRSNTFPR